MDVTTDVTDGATAAPPGRRERKKQETRRRLETAAVDLFEAHGDESTTVEDITASSGPSRCCCSALAVVGLVGVVSFLVDGFAPTVEGLRWLQDAFAFRWAVGHDPLETGVDVTGLVVLLAASAVLAVVALVAHDRRDLTV